MTTLEVGKKLVELCNAGKAKVHETLYSTDISSVEAGAPPGQSSCEGLWPHDDQFIVKFKFEVTFKPENKRFTMEEAALYTVSNGKIVNEKFFYAMS